MKVTEKKYLNIHGSIGPLTTAAAAAAAAASAASSASAAAAKNGVVDAAKAAAVLVRETGNTSCISWMEVCRTQKEGVGVA